VRAGLAAATLVRRPFGRVFTGSRDRAGVTGQRDRAGITGTKPRTGEPGQVD